MKDTRKHYETRSGLYFAEHLDNNTRLPPSEFTSRYIEARDPKILEYLKYISDSRRNRRQECMCHHIGVDDKMQILVHLEWWGEKNVPLEHILLPIKDAPKTEIDRLSTIAVANLQLHKDKMFRGLV
jgi:hypothetical protein